MSNHPYSTSPPLPPPFPQGHRRPSYATVAAASGSSNSLHTSQHRRSAASTASTSREAILGVDHTHTNIAMDTSTSGWDMETPSVLPFFTPSYLQGSRYVSRLRRLGRRPSSSGSEKIPSSHTHNHNHHHRPVVHDVVERHPSPALNERLHHLPSRWNDEDKWTGIEILGDGMEVRFNGVTKTTDDAAAVRSDCFMPKEVGIYYFEVTLLSRAKDGLVGIGFSTSKVQLNRLPGWESESYAYHGDDGCVFTSSSTGKVYGPRYCSQDVIGCGINFRTGTCFFTKNGNNLGMYSLETCGNAFTDSIIRSSNSWHQV